MVRMAIAADIGWGKYRSYEGPFYRGKVRYQLPAGATDEDKILAVITATEGGHLDAYNGYDRCIRTSGLIQWCDRAPQHSVDNMLGKVAEKDRALLKAIDELCRETGYNFRRSVRGKWRSFNGDKEVSNSETQRKLFFLNSDGKKGSWDTESKVHAKKWAAATSSVWEAPEAQAVQRTYTGRRLLGFALPKARRLIKQAPSTGVGRAFTAGYLSFAANNPTWAWRALEAALKEWNGRPLWNEQWLIHILKSLTFHPSVAIYPHRYKAIRPVLERLYGVQLPDFPNELKAWTVKHNYKGYITTLRLQEALLTLGYDLGPAGADDRFGTMTREALKEFEEDAGVPEAYRDGSPDEFTVPSLEKALEELGAELLWENVDE